LEEKARPHEPLQRRVEAIHVPLSEESEDVLTRSYRERLAFRGSPLQRLVGFSPAFVDVLDPPPEFAVVPLPAAEHVLGVLYVDNKFTGRAITAERFELLQSFTSQVALIIENARVLSIEREQSERLRRLRSQHMTFVTGAIHELSGAVANIPDVVGELERKIARGDDISAPIAALNRSACNAKEVMSRLHDLNLPPFKLQLTALRNLVQRAILDTLSQRPRHVVIHFAQDSPDPLVRADKAWLKLLFRNLIKNAYEAIPADREGRVEVRIVQTTEGDVKITVKDNGSGIAPEDQERIFEAGYSTKPHTSSFAGMGLAFCRQVAEEHGGTLTVEGEPDGGAMFTLLLPGEGSS
jgi:signal transduction histidine kinase